MRLEAFHSVFLGAAALLLVSFSAWCLAAGERGGIDLALALVGLGSSASIVAYGLQRRRRVQR